MANEKADQSMFDIFSPIEGVDAPVDPAKRADTAAHIADVARGRLPFEPRTSEAFADLGGGTSETAATEPPRPKSTPRPRRPIGHVRDVEPRDSDLDPFWSTPAPRLSDEQQQEQRDIYQRGGQSARGILRRATAATEYEKIKDLPVSHQQAIMRAREERRGR